MRVGPRWTIAGTALAIGCSSSDAVKSPSLSITSWFSASGDRAEAPASSAAALPAAPVAAPAETKLGPRVTLTGETRAAVTIDGPAVPLYARAAKAWIYERPSEDARHIGYLRAGDAVAVVRSVEGNAGCPGGWHALLTRGYACVGMSTTLDATDPVVRALGANPPEAARKLPYIYGTVRKPGPVYARLPTSAELAKSEPELAERMETWLGAGGEIGASFAQSVWLGGTGEPPDPRAAWREHRSDGVPAFLASGAALPNLHQKPRDPGQLVVGWPRPRVGYSFVTTFLSEGRRYGLTPELELVPTDRLRPIQGSDFHGVQIGGDVSLPFALVRQPGAHYVAYQRAGDRLVDGAEAPYREAVMLTGRQQFFHDVLHYETKDGHWLSDRDASRLDPARKMPGWAVKGERWIDVNITKQTLVLYDGVKPVYATLISSGEAGLEDSKRTTATKRGIFRIHAKHVSNTMESDEVGEEFELRDVPYVQYFDDDGHAIHGAYWHDKFGIPKSHGCINLAPEDARRIFYYTEPEVPDGWHGAFDAHRGTVVFIHP
ncbi:MAG TPA: L,D-transpeptidase [Polyangiaceae bacterium]|jgi:hypothetical protein|nr:L,D-transpeptidase [Polyangiaceae bacterium]